MNVLLIPTDTASPIREVEVDGLADLQALVGGYIQSIPFPGRRDVIPYFAEEGKFEGLAPNARATRLLASALFAGDYIAGDCVLTGVEREALAPLPADVARLLCPPTGRARYGGLG